MTSIDVMIEIPYNSYIKYEYDEKLKAIRCDRILNTSMCYPGNYGFIPNTLSGDGDPLDILLLSDYPLFPGTIITFFTVFSPICLEVLSSFKTVLPI